MTLRQIVELRTAAGTCPMSADNYLAVADFARAREEVDERVMSLVDGRSIRVRHAPAPDGGWTSTHEDITELHEKRLLLEERLSLQSLIDATPDNLSVKRHPKSICHCQRRHRAANGPSKSKGVDRQVGS